MQLAGASYLANTFALILAPALANALFPAIMLPPFIAELSLALWLLVKGVDVPKWKEKAGTSGVAGSYCTATRPGLEVVR